MPLHLFLSVSNLVIKRKYHRIKGQEEPSKCQDIVLDLLDSITNTSILTGFMIFLLLSPATCQYEAYYFLISKLQFLNNPT